MKKKLLTVPCLLSLLFTMSCAENRSESLYHYSIEEMNEVIEVAKTYGFDIKFNSNLVADKLTVDDFTAIFDDIQGHPDMYVSEVHEINDSTLCIVYDLSRMEGVAIIESQAEVAPFSLQSKDVGIYSISITIGMPNGDSAGIDWVITDKEKQTSKEGSASGLHDQNTCMVNFSFSPQFITNLGDTLLFNVSNGYASVLTQHGDYSFTYVGLRQHQDETEDE